MAELSGVHFEYGGVSSRLFHLITANVETKRFLKVAGNIKGETLFSKKEKKQYLISDDYSDAPLSFELEIVKDDEIGIEFNERRKIEKWLFNRSSYKRFYIDLEDDWFGETTELVDGIQKRLYLNCRFVNPERLEYNGGIIGYRATLEADSGMWWQEEVTKTYTIGATAANAVNDITVETDSDMDDYLQPVMKVTIGGTGQRTIEISNLTDDADRKTSFQTDVTGTIIINSVMNYVSGGYYSTMTSRNFPRLLDGENKIRVKGPVTKIEITFNNRRML